MVLNLRRNEENARQRKRLREVEDAKKEASNRQERKLAFQKVKRVTRIMLGIFVVFVVGYC